MTWRKSSHELLYDASMHRSTLPPHLPREISREALAALPLKRYEGEVVMVHSRAALERAVEDLHAERVVGWDTETRPAFRPGESYLPSVVQMATASAVYLFQPRRFDVAHELSGFFAAAAMLKVGISVADDLKKLGRLFEGRFPEAPAGVLDAGHVAKRHGMAQTGLRNLAGIFLGVRVGKGPKTTNWAATHLTDAQVAYAATDAWICRELYLR